MASLTTTFDLFMYVMAGPFVKENKENHLNAESRASLGHCGPRLKVAYYVIRCGGGGGGGGRGRGGWVLP